MNFDEKDAAIAHESLTSPPNRDKFTREKNVMRNCRGLMVAGWAERGPARVSPFLPQ